MISEHNLNASKVEFNSRGGNIVLAAFQRVLALNVGSGRRFGVAELAEACELPERTLRSYLPGEGKQPLLCAALQVLAALGPAALSAVLATVGYGARPLRGEPASPFQALAGMGEGVSQLATALADGRIDHHEAAGLVAMARGLAHELEALAATLEQPGS
jgi:hypothetical protein